MSRIKRLREDPENIVNIADIFDRMFSKKSKYTELFMRLLKEHPDVLNVTEYLKNDTGKELEIPVIDFEIYSNLEFLTFSEIIRSFGIHNFKAFLTFISLNERGLISNKDITTYKTIEDIKKSLTGAEVAVYKKGLERQIKIVFEDDDWFLLRPLTHLSSRKYGANTRWCTTSMENKNAFYEYSERNALIYCINKKNGIKVAALKDMGEGPQRISFWNSEDERIDSLDSDLPNYILNEIQKETIDNPYPNVRFLPEDYFNSDEYREYLRMYEQVKEPIPVPMEQPRIVERVLRNYNAVEEAPTGGEVMVKKNYREYLPNTSSDGDYGNTQSA